MVITLTRAQKLRQLVAENALSFLSTFPNLNISDKVTVEGFSESRNIAANVPTFDFLPQVTNTVYFIDRLSIKRRDVISGTALLGMMGLTGNVATITWGASLSDIQTQIQKQYCLRLYHDPNTATAGSGVIWFTGFKLYW